MELVTIRPQKPRSGDKLLFPAGIIIVRLVVRRSYKVVVPFHHVSDVPNLF